MRETDDPRHLKRSGRQRPGLVEDDRSWPGQSVERGRIGNTQTAFAPRAYHGQRRKRTRDCQRAGADHDERGQRPRQCALDADALKQAESQGKHRQYGRCAREHGQQAVVNRGMHSLCGQLESNPPAHAVDQPIIEGACDFKNELTI